MKKLLLLLSILFAFNVNAQTKKTVELDSFNATYNSDSGSISFGSAPINGTILFQNGEFTVYSNEWLNILKGGYNKLNKDLFIDGSINNKSINIIGYNTTADTGVFINGTTTGGLDSKGVIIKGAGNVSDITIAPQNGRLKIENIQNSDTETNILAVAGNGLIRYINKAIFFDTTSLLATKSDLNNIQIQKFGDTYTKEYNKSVTTATATATFDLTSVGFTNITNIQATARLDGSTLANMPIAGVSVSGNTVTVNLIESNTTTVAILNTAVEGLENHTTAGTVVYLTVKGN